MAKRGVMVIDMLVGETLELAHQHITQTREGLDTQKISLTLIAKTGQRARLAVLGATVTRPDKRTATA